MVLAFGLQPVEKLGRGDALVRLEPCALAQTHKGIGFLGARSHDTARAVILEGPAHQHLVIGQQGRGQRVTLVPLEILAVEAERDLLSPVQKAATCCETRAH